MPDQEKLRSTVTELQISDARDTLLIKEALTKATNNESSGKALHKRVDSIERSLAEMPTKQDFKDLLDSRDNATIALATKKILYGVGASVVAAATAAGIKFGGGS